MGMNIDELNARFGVAGRVEFFVGRGERPSLQVSNDDSHALISLYGAQVVSFKSTADYRERLFLSDQALFETGKAIRGGIPLCWPWFGADPQQQGRAAHGFARTMDWSIWAVEESGLSETSVTLRLEPNEETRKIWPHEFTLELIVVVGATLSLSLHTRNTGDDAFTMTQALHTYFQVDNIADTQVEGLDQCQYLDKVAGDEKTQRGSVGFDQEVDRVYLKPASSLQIVEAGKQSVIIDSTGSDTAVVWNPWVDKTIAMADLTAYQEFVCVETTNAAPNVVELRPGERHCLRAEYRFI